MASQNINSKKLTNTRLALDIGTNSIGWALYNLDKKSNPCRIAGAGVRIFSSGRKPKDNTTLNATRRQARLQRRQRDRYIQRRNYLLHLMKKHGVFPKESAKNLQGLNPYELRAKGLDNKLPIHHFGRALFHINQRRGFKSNRKSSIEKEAGVIDKSIGASKELMQKQGARTYGEFLWHRFQKMEVERKKPGSQQENWILARKPIGAGAKDNYAVYAKRNMLEHEFNQLWDKQAEFHDILKDPKLKNTFFEAIFKQRPLKKPVVGKCELIPEEERISKALPSFQRFRILKELNSLKYVDNQGKDFFIAQMEGGREFLDRIIKEQFLKKKKVTFSALEKEFKKFFPQLEDSFSCFNLDSFNRDDLEGDLTGCVLKKIIPDWFSWPLDTQDQFVDWLEGNKLQADVEKNKCMREDEEILKDLQELNKQESLNLSDKQLRDSLSASSRLPSNHGKYSKKAIGQILPFLEEGESEYSAVKSAFPDYGVQNQNEVLQDKLPPYHQILKSHCVPMKSKVGQEENRIPNPTVHIAFNQLRLLVNDIIRIYGKPIQVVIETARDLPLGKVGKSKLEKQQKDNKTRNDKAREAITEFENQNNMEKSEKVSKEDLIRYKLWKDQKCTCVYSGSKISQSDLWTEKLEVDHILPFSKTLDDSFMNKVLVYKQFNQQKGDQTPFDCFSVDEEHWQGILQRVKDLSKGKQWRFNKTAMDRFKEDEGFLARQLNDTRYISKYAKEYLKSIVKDKNVWTVRGQTTAILRGLLEDKTKDRSDHRNHATDAFVIGLIDRSFVNHISKIAKRIEKQNHKSRLENIRKAIKKDVFPWPSFKEDVKKAIDNIVVSHRKSTKKEGKLHNETAYGVSRKVRDFNKPVDVWHYVDILSLDKANEKKISKIMSERVRADFEKEHEINQVISKEFLINYHKKTGIRRIRLQEIKSVIPIQDRKSKKVYKAFHGDSNYSMRIFKNEQGKWVGEVISTFKANQKDFKPVPKHLRLMKGDMLFFENRFWKLVKFDKNNRLIFIEHFVSKNPETKHQVNQKSPSALKKACAKRVNISPAGKVSLTDFNVSKPQAQKKAL